MNGFDDFDTTITAEEYYQPALCTQCGQKEAVEDGFCSFDCENTAFAELHRGAVEWSDSEVRELNNSGMYDDFLSQYDDDPSPYGGTYSEE